MSVRGINIPLDLSAVIVPLHGKLGNNTAGEDNPSAPSPAVILDMHNVMPSELGYSSAFGMLDTNGGWFPLRDTSPNPLYYAKEDTEWEPSIQVAQLLKDAKTQDVIPYSAPNGDLCYLILTEMGIMLKSLQGLEAERKGWFGQTVSGGESDGGVHGYTVLHSITSEDSDLFHLWTTAFLDNRMYFFLQGQKTVFILGDKTLHSDILNWDEGATVLFSNEYLGLQLVEATPTFLNMDGQIGIFQAGNRLGFWDSDNAIAWSSVFNKIDFTPDVVDLAGITKFTDVQGDIVNILPTLDGFIVYSTGSIVEVKPLASSEERWGATTILRDDGIDYYFHAATGTDPKTHFAWTHSSLVMIQNGSATPIKVEEYRELKAQRPPFYAKGVRYTDWNDFKRAYQENLRPNYLYRLKAINQDYLIISRCAHWVDRGAEIDFEFGSIESDYGDKGFYLPTIKPQTPGNEWADFINGRDERPNLTSPDWEIDDNIPNIPKETPLVPCYDVYGWRGLSPAAQISLANSEADWDAGSSVPWNHALRDFPNIKVSRAIEIRDGVANPLLEQMTSPGFFPKQPGPLPGRDWIARPDPGEVANKHYDQYGVMLLVLVDQVWANVSAHVNFVNAHLRKLLTSNPNSSTADLFLAGNNLNVDHALYRPDPDDIEGPVVLNQLQYEGHTLEDSLEETPEPYASAVQDGWIVAFKQLRDLRKAVAQTEIQLKEMKDQYNSMGESNRKEQLAIAIAALEESFELMKEQEVELTEKAEFIRQVAVNGDTTNYPWITVTITEAIMKQYLFAQFEFINVQNECGLDIYGFIDDLNHSVIYYRQLAPIEETFREWGIPDKDLGGMCEPVGCYDCRSDTNDRIMGKMQYPQDSPPYCEVDPEAIDCYGHLGPVGSPISLETSGCGTQFKYLGAMQGYVFHKVDHGVIPRSFKGKSLDAIIEMLDFDAETKGPWKYEQWESIFSANLSGYGYPSFPNDPYSHFVKVISRARLDVMWAAGRLNVECGSPQDSRVWTDQPTNDDINKFYKWNDDDFDYDYTPAPDPYLKDPEHPGFDINDYLGPYVDMTWSARYRKGTGVPYYPSYEKAWVLDLISGKWGSLDYPHSFLFPTYSLYDTSGAIAVDVEKEPDFEGGRGDWSPRNPWYHFRTGVMPFGIVPHFGVEGMQFPAGGMHPQVWALEWMGKVNLLRHQLPTFLSNDGIWSGMVIGGIALEREGYTKLTGMYCNGVGNSASIVVGETGFVRQHLSWAKNLGDAKFAPYQRKFAEADQLTYSKARVAHRSYSLNEASVGGKVLTYGDVRMPFVLTAKEFEFAVDGNFRLHKLICYGQATGRLRFDP